MGVFLRAVFALLALQTEISWGQGDGTRVFDGGSTSKASGSSGQGTSSSSSGLSSSSNSRSSSSYSSSSSSSSSSFDSDDLFSSSSSSSSSSGLSSRSSSRSSSSSTSSSSSSSYFGPGLGAILEGLFSLFSPPPSSRRTPVSRQTWPRKPPSARRQPATKGFQPQQRRQQQTSSRRYQGVQKSTPRRISPLTVQKSTPSNRIQPVGGKQITADSFPLPAMGCSCNGLVTSRGQGECKTLWHQDGVPKAFCYTDEGRCGDQQRSPSGR